MARIKYPRDIDFDGFLHNLYLFFCFTTGMPTACDSCAHNKDIWWFGLNTKTSNRASGPDETRPRRRNRMKCPKHLSPFWVWEIFSKNRTFQRRHGHGAPAWNRRSFDTFRISPIRPVVVVRSPHKHAWADYFARTIRLKRTECAHRQTEI